MTSLAANGTPCGWQTGLEDDLDPWWDQHRHVGALYLPRDKGKPAQQTVGQGAWHDLLRGAFSQAKDRKDYGAKLKGVVEDTVWDGNLDFLPDDFRPHAKLIANDYVGKPKVQLPGDLKALGDIIDEFYYQQLIPSLKAI